ncbi:SHOCT domain-containing protein [Actinospica durhamensis]|nr:SHOCT domain-containing protein [Actinospica durhamensis]
MVARAGRPGLLGTAARTAVVAGTATAVSGRVRARQDARYAENDQAAYQQQPAPAPAPQAAQPTGGVSDEALAKLERLAQLQQQGVLTEEEFAAQKAQILGQ